MTTRCRTEQREGPGNDYLSECSCSVVLSSAKDLGLPVILSGVKNLALLLKGFYPIFALKKQGSE